MSAEQLSEGIWRVATTARDNAFLVAGDDGFTLVDVGWAKAPGVILAALDELGRKPRDVRRIVLTHAHPDHVQGAAELRELTGAEALIHSADAAWLPAGRVPPAGRQGVLGRLIDRVPKLHWRPFTADGTLADGDVVGGLTVVHTPGHSPGHIVLVHEPTRTLLTGDAVFNRGPRPAQGPAALTSDAAARDASVHRLPTEVVAVGFAHGRPLTARDVDSYHAWLAGIRDSA